MARIFAWQLVEAGVLVSPDQRSKILDALLIKCISLHCFLAARRLVIVTFVYHICRAASSSSPGSRSCRSLRPQSAALFPPVSMSYCFCVTVLLSFTTSDHHRHLKTSALWCHCSETRFPLPCLKLRRKPKETETSCILKIQFSVLCRAGGCKSSFSLFLHHLWWCNLSAFPVLSGRIFC